MIDILMLAILPVLLSGSAFFSGCETAIFSLTKHQRLQLSRSRTLAASIITRLVSDQRAVLVTVLMANMVVNVLYFVIGSVLTLNLSAVWGNALNIAAFMLLILMGEVLPKLVAARFPMRWSLLAAVPLLILHRGLSPLRIMLRAGVVDPLSRLLAPQQRPVALSPQELESLLELSEHEGVIDDQEEQLLQQVLSLSQIKVKHLMTPRVDIKAFNLADDPQQLLGMARRTRLTHFPIYEGDLDQIVGVVFCRQVLLANPQTHRQVKTLIRQPKFVPELQRADRLLVELRRQGPTMAIAVDEHGGTAGLVTLEDVVEQMVGQIANPYEPQMGPPVEAIGSDRWRVSARLGIRQWTNAFGTGGTNLGVRTVGGLVMAKLGRVPQIGDRTTVGNLSIKVEGMSGRRIDHLLLQLHREPGEQGGS